MPTAQTPSVKTRFPFGEEGCPGNVTAQSASVFLPGTTGLGQSLGSGRNQIANCPMQSLGPPVPFSFFGEGSSAKIDCRKRVPLF